MRFGKIAIALFLIGGAAVAAFEHYHAPTWHDPGRALVGLVAMVSFALAGVAGAIGSKYDRRKWPAIVVSGVAVGFLLLMLLWQGFAWEGWFKKGPQMYYGKTAAKTFAILGVAIPLVLILRPGWGTPLGIFVKSLQWLCPPVALAFSLIGAIRDQRKWYAIVMLLVSAVFTILLLRGLVQLSVPAFRPGTLPLPWDAQDVRARLRKNLPHLPLQLP